MATKAWKEQNIDKMRAYRRKWYANNKKHAKNKIKERKKDIATWLHELKTTLKCNRCPEIFTECLEFHHKNPKKKEITISLASRNGWSKEKILKEIQKCEVLCANCHRKEHYNQK